MEYTQVLIEKIREVKKERHLSNEKICELSGVAEATVSRILNGTSKRPSFDSILSMATALGISEENILVAAFNGEEPPQEVEAVAESYANVLSVKETKIEEQEKRIKVLEDSNERYKRNNVKLTTAVFVLGAVLCVVCIALSIYFVYDVLHGDIGYIRR